MKEKFKAKADGGLGIETGIKSHKIGGIVVKDFDMSCFKYNDKTCSKYIH